MGGADRAPDGTVQTAGDTSPEAEAVLLRLAREAPPARKLQIAEAMTRAVREAARAGILARHPGATEEEVRRRLAALLLPPGIAQEAYGWDPARDGY